MQELLKDKEFYELNRFADGFKFAQSGYKILYERVSAKQDVAKIVNSINEVDSYDSLLNIFIGYYKQNTIVYTPSNEYNIEF